MRTRYAMALVAAVLMLVVLLFGTLVAQPCTTPVRRARLIVSDSSGIARDTLWFGFHDSATVGLDTRLCESEYPPFPPTGVFEGRFVNPPGREGMEPPAGLGQGVRQDYRQRTSVSQIDTHRVKFQPYDPPGYPVRLQWSRSEVAAMCDSCILVDEFGGVAIPRTPMTSQDGLVITLPAIQELLMIRYGQRLTGVEQTESGVPGSFALEQNYPNPFNPSTTIRFSIQRAAMTDISVYDILGRKVATLASELLAPGYYTVHWDGSTDSGGNAASGVYFVRMDAQADKGNFSASRKLLLMK